MTWNSSPAPGRVSALEIASDSRELERFLDREFDGTPGLGAEYPLLIGPRNGRRRWIARADGEIVSHVAWRPLGLRSEGRTIRAAGIGLVTTARRWRGQGLARRCLESSLTDARAQGAEIALLFGSPRSLYRRLGFLPAGRERILRLAPPPQPRNPKPEARRGGPADAARLLPLLADHPLGVERSCEEFQELLAIPRTNLWLRERGDDVLAYAVCGKGRDLVGIVHEWGGHPADVRALLVELAGLGAQAVLAPEGARIPGLGAGQVGNLAQIRVLAAARLGSDDPVQLFGDAHSPAQIPLYVWGLDSF